MSCTIPDYKPESSRRLGKKAVARKGSSRNKRENGKRNKGKKEKEEAQGYSTQETDDQEELFEDKQVLDEFAVPGLVLIEEESKDVKTSKGKEKERGKEDLDPKLPFGGKLSVEDADISRTRPDEIDKWKFDRAKNDAEAKDPKVEEPAQTEDLNLDYVDATPKIRCIRFGDWEIDTWFAAPYPEEYSLRPVLYICEFCLKYMKSQFVANRHKQKCPMRHPPGDEIYRDGAISIFEVDGRKNKIYCQNLCLLAKMFLDHKTLYYDVEPFLFYVMTEYTDSGCHFVGYFSKEKRSPLNYNVSCILTLPIHQRKGYGNLLIDFSYLLTKKENKTGSPEKPLSDLGLLSYRNYWRNIIFGEFRDAQDPISIEELSRRTSMTHNDIISTLQTNNMITKDTDNDTYSIVIDKERITNHFKKVAIKEYPQIKPENLKWTPFILTRGLGLRHVEEEVEGVMVDEKEKKEKEYGKGKNEKDEEKETDEESPGGDVEVFISDRGKKRRRTSTNPVASRRITRKRAKLGREGEENVMNGVEDGSEDMLI